MSGDEGQRSHQGRKIGAGYAAHIGRAQQPVGATRLGGLGGKDMPGEIGPERVTGGFVGEDEGSSHDAVFNALLTIWLPTIAGLSQRGTLTTRVKRPPAGWRALRAAGGAGKRLGHD